MARRLREFTYRDVARFLKRNVPARFTPGGQRIVLWQPTPTQDDIFFTLKEYFLQIKDLPGGFTTEYLNEFNAQEVGLGIGRLLTDSPFTQKQLAVVLRGYNKGFTEALELNRGHITGGGTSWETALDTLIFIWRTMKVVYELVEEVGKIFKFIMWLFVSISNLQKASKSPDDMDSGQRQQMANVMREITVQINDPLNVAPVSPGSNESFWSLAWGIDAMLADISGPSRDAYLVVIKQMAKRLGFTKTRASLIA